MENSAPQCYEFEGFRLDRARRRLSDPSGAALPLSARAFDVLTFLVENRARVVSKDELLRAVWQRVVVEENNLNQAIYGLRKALGDSRESPRFIVTIAGRGYQFIARVQVDTGQAAEQAVTTAGTGRRTPEPASAMVPTPPQTTAPVVRSRRWLLAAGVAAAAGLGGVAWLRRRGRAAGGLPPSVAVLPFKPLLGTGANAAIELGITETLINRLSELPGVVVPPLSTVRRYADAAVDPLLAGRELDVAAVLDGHVQVDGDLLRLTARLLSTSDGRALWTGSFNERLDDFFAVQESLANQVVRALSLELSPEQRHRLARRETADPEALQLFLNGRYHWNRRTDEGFRRALEFYEAAAARDPAFARPYAGIADVLAVQGVFNMRPPGSVFPDARAAVERAIALDERLAEAHASLGHIQLQYGRDLREGERRYRQALAMQPNQAQCMLWLANCLMMRGLMEESLAAGRQAQSLEPMVLAFAANLGMLLTFARKLDQAYTQLSGLFDAAPDSPLLRHHFARLQILRGRPQEAIRLVEGFDARAPGCFSNLGRAYALAGRSTDARTQLDWLRALGAEGFGVGFDAALIHAALDERDAALAALESGLTDGSQMMLYLTVEPGFDVIRREPRFRAVVTRLGLT